ncbi:F-box/lrr-repeat protein [Plakobranchus ocellatus]|uniref:F-box/lrr-repeat protein n=1 Tax=Plakobranchus ocellatus TaxID=259542 RepID=A0AAV3Z505_9GAST|nr:F-box/lrr-repeat protein [Plakobranchus ocellatus]
MMEKFRFRKKDAPSKPEEETRGATAGPKDYNRFHVQFQQQQQQLQQQQQQHQVKQSPYKQSEDQINFCERKDTQSLFIRQQQQRHPDLPHQPLTQQEQHTPQNILQPASIHRQQPLCRPRYLEQQQQKQQQQQQQQQQQPQFTLPKQQDASTGWQIIQTQQSIYFRKGILQNHSQQQQHQQQQQQQQQNHDHHHNHQLQHLQHQQLQHQQQPQENMQSKHQYEHQRNSYIEQSQNHHIHIDSLQEQTIEDPYERLYYASSNEDNSHHLHPRGVNSPQQLNSCQKRLQVEHHQASHHNESHLSQQNEVELVKVVSRFDHSPSLPLTKTSLKPHVHFEDDQENWLKEPGHQRDHSPFKTHELLSSQHPRNRDPPSYHEFQRLKHLQEQQLHLQKQATRSVPPSNRPCPTSLQNPPPFQRHISSSHQESSVSEQNRSPFQKDMNHPQRQPSVTSKQSLSPFEGDISTPQQQSSSQEHSPTVQNHYHQQRGPSPLRHSIQQQQTIAPQQHSSAPDLKQTHRNHQHSQPQEHLKDAQNDGLSEGAGRPPAIQACQSEAIEKENHCERNDPQLNVRPVRSKTPCDHPKELQPGASQPNQPPEHQKLHQQQQDQPSEHQKLHQQQQNQPSEHQKLHQQQQNQPPEHQKLHQQQQNQPPEHQKPHQHQQQQQQQPQPQPQELRSGHPQQELSQHHQYHLRQCNQKQQQQQKDVFSSLENEEDQETSTPVPNGPSPPPYEETYPISERNHVKNHTNWNRVLQDLFGIDSAHHHTTAESTHESTSSGVASDVTSVYPTSPPDCTAKLPTRTFKGADSGGSASSDQQSQDSGNRSTSAPGSPREEFQPNGHDRNLRQLHGAVTAHALTLVTNRKTAPSRTGRRTPDTHPLPPTPGEIRNTDDNHNDVPPPLPQRNSASRAPAFGLAQAPGKPCLSCLSCSNTHAFLSRGGKTYFSTEADRSGHSQGGAGGGRASVTPQNHVESNPPLADTFRNTQESCQCPSCHTVSSNTQARQNLNVIGSKDVDPRVADPAFYQDSSKMSVQEMSSFTDSALGLESFSYESHDALCRKRQDVERSRSSSSPVSPVPPGGHYHNKHGFHTSSDSIDISRHHQPHTATGTLNTRPKRQKHKQSIANQTVLNPDINSDFYSQDSLNNDQHRRHVHHTHSHKQQRQMYHHQQFLTKTSNNVQSVIPEDSSNINRTSSMIDHNHHNHHTCARRYRHTNNANYSSGSSPERVYYPHSDSTPTSTPTSHLSSDAAAVTSVNLESSSISNKASSSDATNEDLLKSNSSKYHIKGKTPHASSRPRSTTPKATSSDSKQHTVLLTSAEVHSSREEDNFRVCIINTSKSSPALGQSESQISRRALSPANQTCPNGNSLAEDIHNLSRSQAALTKLQTSNSRTLHSAAATTDQCPSKSKRSENRGCPFDSLPDDLLLKIFSHLPTNHLCKCAQVCRHWYNAVWDHPALWTSIVINNPNLDINRALKYLTRRLSYNTPKVCMILEKININGCSKLTDSGLQTVVKRCPELRCLDMQGCTLITNTGVTEAVSRCVNLERLDVTGCPLVTCISLTEAALHCGAARHLQRIYLRYLDMSDCPHVTDGDLLTVSSQCTQLLFFYLRRCPLVSDLGVSYIATNCGSLREVSLSDCHNVTDLGMRELAKLGENLRYLSVAKCEKVSDHGVSHIALNCPKLRYLNVRGCEAVSDRGLDLLARSCLRLRSLDVGKCDITDTGLYALSTYCPQLRKLGLKSCDGVTDRGLVLMAYRCPQLRQLHVQDCSRLTPEAYSMVRRYCKGAFIEHTNPGVL